MKTAQTLMWNALQLLMVVVAGWLTCCQLTAGSAEGVAGGDNKAARRALPQPLREALEKQASAMQAVHLEYHVSRVSEAQPGLDGKEAFVTDFDRGSFYWSCASLGPEGGTSLMQVVEACFNGGTFYYGVPSKQWGGTLMKARVDDVTDPIRTNAQVHFPYLEAAGFYAPQSFVEMEKGPAIDSLLLHYLDESGFAKVEQVEAGVRVTLEIADRVLLRAKALDLEQERKRLQRVVREAKDDGGTLPALDIEKEIAGWEKKQKMIPKRKVAFLLDPRRGYVVLEREEWAAAGERIVRIVTEGLRHYKAQGLWLPQRSVASYYTFPDGLLTFFDRPVLVITHTLQEVDFRSAPDGRFGLEQKAEYRKAGAHIIERSSPLARSRRDHQVLHVVSADGALLRKTANEATLEMSPQRRYLWISVVLVLGLLPVVLVFRGKTQP